MRPTIVTAVDLNPAWPRDSSTTGHATPRGQWLQWKPPREASPPQYSHEGGGTTPCGGRRSCALYTRHDLFYCGDSHRDISPARTWRQLLSETSGSDSLFQDKRAQGEDSSGKDNITLLRTCNNEEVPINKYRFRFPHYQTISFIFQLPWFASRVILIPLAKSPDGTKRREPLVAKPWHFMICLWYYVYYQKRWWSER